MRLRLACALPFVSLLALPAPADACGGTVCDSGPNAMPVDQTGENVLFILEPGQVEVHIQIQYDPNTNAQKFAWLIPLPEVPEFAVGSELLFRELLRASVPTYGTNDNFEFCGEGSGTGAGFIDPGSTTSGGDGDTEGGGVDVVKVEQVGAFEIAVLAGDSAADVMQWLVDNDYQQDPNAAPILQQYLDEGNKIIAFKLQNGEGLNSIHPVVLRFPGPDGCVPIRLTRIAAVDDMDIRVFALSDGRAFPTNYRHVLVNPLKIDWLNFGANYKEVVSLAVDAFMAEGHAFVTEFAGASEVVVQDAFHSPAWTAAAYAGLPAVQVIDTLTSQSLADCSDPAFCFFGHPLIEGLLATYLPVPGGLTKEEFYSCLSCYEGQIDLAAWGDGAGFSADFQARVVEPAEHARALLDTWPYLTRLYTTISPNEMTEDPLFLINPDLPDVPNIRIATRDVDCDNHVVVTLPDGRQVHLELGDAWPQFQEEMPWEEDIDQMVPKGMPQPLIDNTPLIDELLAAWNEQHKPQGGDTTGGTSTGEPDPTGSPDPTGGPDPTGAGASTGSTGGGGNTDGASGGGQTGESGCGCRSDPGPGSLLLLGLLGLLRRRRR